METPSLPVILGLGIPGSQILSQHWCNPRVILLKQVVSSKSKSGPLKLNNHLSPQAHTKQTQQTVLC